MAIDGPTDPYQNGFGWRELAKYFSGDLLKEWHIESRGTFVFVIVGILIVVAGLFLMLRAVWWLYQGEIVWSGGGLMLHEKPKCFLIVVLAFFSFGFFFAKPWFSCFIDIVRYKLGK